MEKLLKTLSCCVFFFFFSFPEILSNSLFSLPESAILSLEKLRAIPVSHIAGYFFPESHKNLCPVESISGPQVCHFIFYPTFSSPWPPTPISSWKLSRIAQVELVSPSLWNSTTSLLFLPFWLTHIYQKSTVFWKLYQAQDESK